MSTTFQKIALMVKEMVTDPTEFFYRLASIIDAKIGDDHQVLTDYELLPIDEAVIKLEAAMGVTIAPYLHEAALDEIEAQVNAKVEAIRPHAPFPIFFNANMTTARICFALIRACKCRVVVETGVAYGRSSAFILKAMELNEIGTLHSVDRAPLEEDAFRYIGAIIPDELRHRWALHRGTSRRVLPQLLDDLGQIDMFFHDSLHTFKNMLWEYTLAMPHLKGPALLVSDDIHSNAAFAEWTPVVKPSCSVTIKHVGGTEATIQGGTGVAYFK